MQLDHHAAPSDVKIGRRVCQACTRRDMVTQRGQVPSGVVVWTRSRTTDSASSMPSRTSEGSRGISTPARSRKHGGDDHGSRPRHPIGRRRSDHLFCTRAVDRTVPTELGEETGNVGMVMQFAF